VVEAEHRVEPDGVADDAQPALNVEIVDAEIVERHARSLVQFVHADQRLGGVEQNVDMVLIGGDDLEGGEAVGGILLLADHFIEKYTRRMGSKPVRISSAAIDMLMSYHWPGNVRELENCIERAVLLAKGQSIKAHHLPPTLQKKSTRETKEMPTLEAAVNALEREMIVDVLKETHSNMAEASRRLGLTERKIGLRVKKYDIDLECFRK